MTQSNLGFIPDPITVAFDKLLPSRKAPDGLMSSRKFNPNFPLAPISNGSH